VLCPPLPGTPRGDRFDERRIGLDHLAVRVGGGRRSPDQLEVALRSLGAHTDGVELDRDGVQSAIMFRDTANFQWEFFEED
jgi:hypothetical protein